MQRSQRQAAPDESDRHDCCTSEHESDIGQQERVEPAPRKPVGRRFEPDTSRDVAGQRWCLSTGPAARLLAVLPRTASRTPRPESPRYGRRVSEPRGAFERRAQAPERAQGQGRSVSRRTSLSGHRALLALLVLASSTLLAHVVDSQTGSSGLRAVAQGLGIGATVAVLTGVSAPSGRRWREQPLAERLLPTWFYALLTVLCLALGIWCWVGIDAQTPLERSRPVAVVLWLLMGFTAGLAALSRRARAGR